MFRFYNLPDSPFTGEERLIPNITDWIETVMEPGTSFGMFIFNDDYFEDIGKTSTEIYMESWNKLLEGYGIYVQWEEPEPRIYLQTRSNVSGIYPVTIGYWLYGVVIAKLKEHINVADGKELLPRML